MTKKITRLFCIVLALALVCTFVAGCSMFQTNADRYREKTAFKVGEQTVTVGALEDFINTNMSNYLNQGYDIQSVWDALMPQFIMNYVLVDMLKEDLPWPKVTPDAFRRFRLSRFGISEKRERHGVHHENRQKLALSVAGFACGNGA